MPIILTLTSIFSCKRGNFNDEKKTTGIGLQNIKHRVEALFGKINIDSTLGKGTAINIAIPINGIS